MTHTRVFGPGGAMEAFEAANKAGKCRFFGFTGHADPHPHCAAVRRSTTGPTLEYWRKKVEP